MTYNLRVRGLSPADALAAVAASDLPDELKAEVTAWINAAPPVKNFDLTVIGTDTNDTQYRRQITSYNTVGHLSPP